MKLKFTPSGRRQFLAAVAYIHQERPAAGRRFLNRVGQVMRRLEKFPDSGRVIPEFPELPYREVVIPPYRFFYRVDTGIVWVVGAWHSAQQVQQPDRDA